MSATSAAVSALIGTATGLAGAVTGLTSFIPQGNIGGIAVDVTIEEIATDTIAITEQPVEQGADITDHSYVRPCELTMRCGWSNASAAAASGLVQSLFSGGSPTPSDYVTGVYSQLLALQQSRQTFTVTTSKRQYVSMLMPSLVLHVDKDTSQALMITATMKQIIIVSTQTTTLPPAANQANPQDTQETANVGPTAPISGQTPAPGGALPPPFWAPTGAPAPYL